MKNEIIKCMRHDTEFPGQFIKYGKRKNGEQIYRCKECIKEIRRKHYLKNKDEIKNKHRIYKNKNPERYRIMHNIYNRKNWLKNKEKEIKRSMEWDKNNPNSKISRQKKHSKKGVIQMTDWYIKKIITNRSILKFHDVPPCLVKLKRSTIKLKRFLKSRETNNG